MESEYYFGVNFICKNMVLYGKINLGQKRRKFDEIMKLPLLSEEEEKKRIEEITEKLEKEEL